MLTSIIQKLTIAFLVLFFFQLNAQTYFGLRAGTNFANGSKGANDYGASTDRILGINLGMYLDFGLSKIMSLQSEANWLQKGFRAYGQHDKAFRNSYIDLVFLLKLKNNNIPYNKKGKKMGIYGAFGPYGGYIFYSKVNKLKSINRFDVKRDVEDSYIVDFGFMLSAGTSIPADRKNFIFDLRYIHGFMQMDDDRYGKPKNRGILPSVGFVWKI
jgi:Outer membrane protein beta-barrel domain